jgi:hypothetical protein
MICRALIIAGSDLVLNLVIAVTSKSRDHRIDHPIDQQIATSPDHQLDHKITTSTRHTM